MSKIIWSTLGKIGQVKMCKRILKSQTSDSGDIPFYKISTFGNIADSFISKEIFNEYKRKYSYPKKGDILLSASGTLGKTVIYNGEDAYYQDSNIVWIDNDESKVLNRYLYYFYKIIKWKITTGSTINRLYNENILGSEIFYPEDLKEQVKIINILSTIDNKINNNNQINKELESLAKMIYDYWFLQFEFPNEEGKPYKSSGGKMVWNDDLKREIPEGWKVDELDKYIDFNRGISYLSKDIEKGIGLPMINLASIDINRNYKPRCLKFYDGLSKNYRFAEPWDMLIACTDLTRNAEIIGCPIFTPDDKNYLYTMDLAKIIFKNSLINPFYLYGSLRTEYYHNYIKGFASGTNVLHLNLDGIRWFRILIPPLNIQEKYAILIKNSNKKIFEIYKENEQLIQLRDFLLPLLMNGQVTFKEEK